MKKSLTITITLLYLSWNGFSQTDTTVNLRPAVAVQAIADIIRGDDCKVRVGLLSDNITQLNKIIEKTETEARLMKENEARLKLMISNLQALNASGSQLEKKYKAAIRVGRLKNIVIGGLAGYGLFKTFVR